MVTVETQYGTTVYIGTVMVLAFSPYIRKISYYFQFQVNLTFDDFTAQNMSKLNCVYQIFTTLCLLNVRICTCHIWNWKVKLHGAVTLSNGSLNEHAISKSEYRKSK